MAADVLALGSAGCTEELEPFVQLPDDLVLERYRERGTRTFRLANRLRDDGIVAQMLHLDTGD